MSEAESTFDWSPLGEEWWAEAKATCGGTWEQARFACGRHSRNLTMAQAARDAGYAGDDDSIRQAGSRAAKTTAVMAMLAMAAAETGGGHDGNVSRAEAKSILSRLARGSDPNVRIKAFESLNKIESQEQEQRASEANGHREPAEILREIASISPALAMLIAAQDGIEFAVTDEDRAAYAQRRADLARRWMQDHSAEARAVLGAPGV